jgi:hypothetical protein
MTPASAGATSKIAIRKPYAKPTLVRGPLINEVTAVTGTISGGTPIPT